MREVRDRRNAERADAVQTTMGMINVLRVLSGLEEIPVASLPLWACTCRHPRRARPPRRADAAPRRRLRGGHEWPCQGRPGYDREPRPATGQCRPVSLPLIPVMNSLLFCLHTIACPCSGPESQVNATGHLEVTCNECGASLHVTAHLAVNVHYTTMRHGRCGLVSGASCPDDGVAELPRSFCPKASCTR